MQTTLHSRSNRILRALVVPSSKARIYCFIVFSGDGQKGARPVKGAPFIIINCELSKDVQVSDAPLFNRLKIGDAVLAERTDEVLGQLLALVDIAANLADPALFALGFGLGLDVVLVVGVSHGLTVGKDT